MKNHFPALRFAALLLAMFVLSAPVAQAQGGFIFLDIGGLLLMKLGIVVGLLLLRLLLGAIAGR